MESTPITGARTAGLLAAAFAVFCIAERAEAGGCVVLADPSTFTYDTLPSPDGRYIQTITFPPAGSTNFHGFGYVGTFPSATPEGGLSIPTQWNLYEIDSAGTGTLVIGNGMHDALSLKFAPSGVFQGRLFGTESALPFSIPNAVYDVFPGSTAEFTSLSGASSQGINGLAFPGGGSLGDLLYVANFCSAGCGTFQRSISAYDSAGSFQGHLVQGATDPYHLAVDHSGTFGEYVYYTSLASPVVRRVDASGVIEDFATLVQAPNYSGELTFGLGGAFGNELYIAGAAGTIWRVDSSGQAQLFASGFLTTSAIAFEPASGDLFVGDAANGIVRIRPGTTVGYCVAGTSASGCTPSLTTSGTPSATATSGFSLCATGVEGQQDGLFYFGTNGRQARPWGNGMSLQCVAPPVSRTGLLTGTGSAGVCDGELSRDLNAQWCPSCPGASKNPGAGTIVQAQLWYRDPLNTSNQPTSLSEAVEFVVQP
jgi:hypothetical protein